MSRIQRFFTAIFPRTWAESMEAESRKWMIRCDCGYERSVWEAGGIRWKGAGYPQTRLFCPTCGKITWQTVYYREAPPAS